MLCMRSKFWYVLISAIFTCSAGVHRTTPLLDTSSSSQPALQVRVLLNEQQTTSAPSWSLSSSSGFILRDGAKPKRKQRLKSTNITLSYYKNAFWLNNKRIATQHLYISTPDDEPIQVGDAQYAGYMMLRVQGKAAYLINVVDIEEYVFSVLRWEGWPGWPDEVNKTFAIMCRTYVVDKVWHERKQHKNSLYDIKNTNIHQTYKGLHGFKRMRYAIEATRGTILTYTGKPILAMYDSCCGGIIPARVSGFDFRKAPYLARTYPCRFCKTTNLYTWQRSYTLEHFRQMLSKHLRTRVGRIRDIRVTQRDKAKVVQEVHVRTNSGWMPLSGRALYGACDGLRSLCFSIKIENGSVIFNGYGFGHHIGLCQWGAREMVRRGWDHKNILKFFYPSVSFMKLRISSKE